MARWVQVFGAIFIASAALWVIFAGTAEWQIASGVMPQLNIVHWSSLSAKIAIASFGATLVTVAMQWSARVDPDELSRRWREPESDR